MIFTYLSRFNNELTFKVKKKLKNNHKKKKNYL